MQSEHKKGRKNNLIIRFVDAIETLWERYKRLNNVYLIQYLWIYTIVIHDKSHFQLTTFQLS